MHNPAIHEELLDADELERRRKARIEQEREVSELLQKLSKRQGNRAERRKRASRERKKGKKR